MSFLPRSRTARSLWIVCIALFFIVVIAPLVVSADNPLTVSMNASIDRKITTTLELAGASSAASLAVSAIPGDTATPVAEKLADFGSGFLLVLCVLYFEKMMFGVIGYILCILIIPGALLLLMSLLIANTYSRHIFSKSAMKTFREEV